ncbi:SH3 domain-containing protein [Longilinea arvoryzae]|uniref:SH3 domain-containing protein n=1 Tax=Longilinea arvoryzae TaxID=360412 RepID=UPI00126012CC|nr:SH3 domain-containing protein [Longilinea arvoryzae]
MRILACGALIALLLSACAAPAGTQPAANAQQTAPGETGKPTRTPFPTRRPPAGTRTPTVDPSAQPTEGATQVAGTGTPGAPASGTAAAGAVTLTFGGALNVRRGPGLAYDTVAAFETGQTVAAKAQDGKGEWLQVEVPNSTGVFGWVYSKAPTVNVSGDPLSLPDATFTDAVPAYVRNCTSHQISLRPGEIVLEPLAQQPANRQQVNPGFYEVVDLTLNAASVTTMSVTEGSELIVTQDGNGVNYTCPR